MAVFASKAAACLHHGQPHSWRPLGIFPLVPKDDGMSGLKESEPKHLSRA